MTDWKANKGLGPWPFAKQPNKWGYLNNPNWVNDGVAPISYDGNESAEPIVWSIDPTNNVRTRGTQDKHNPCGHWHRPVDVAPPEPLYPQDVYFAENCQAKVFSLDDELADKIAPVSSGINWGCCTDGLHFYVCNYSQNRLEKRSLTDLSVISYISGRPYGNCTDGSDILWGNGYGYISRGISKYTKSTLAHLHYYNETELGHLCPQYALDMTVDDQYLYVADAWGYRIQRYNKSSMVLSQSYGMPRSYNFASNGIWVSGDYAYIVSSGSLLKVDKVTWEIVDILGDDYSYDFTGYKHDGNLAAYDVIVVGSYLYTIGYAGVNRFDISNFDIDGVNIIPNTDSGYGTLGDSSYQACYDGTYIYICSLDAYITKWNLATGAFVAENGDRSYETEDGENAYNYPCGIACDDTYLYIIDQNDTFRVIKRLKSDLSYVSEYRSTEYWEDPITSYEWANPQGLICDDTYLYISSPQYPAGFVRMDKATLTFVDFINIDDGDHSGNGVHEAMDMFIDGSYLYVSDYDSGAARFNLADFSFVSRSPEDTTFYDEEDIFDDLTGITVDEDYVYVVSSSVVKIYNKLTFTFVDSFTPALGNMMYPAVDSKYLYICHHFSTLQNQFLTDYVKKYLKVPPYTEIGSNSTHHPISCDKAWLYQLGHYTED